MGRAAVVGGGPHLEVGEGDCDKRGDYKKDQEHKQQDPVELGGHAHNKRFFLMQLWRLCTCTAPARAYINLKTS